MTIKCVKTLHLLTHNGLRLAAGGEIEFLLPGTVAKFIIKCSLFILSLDRVSSARKPLLNNVTKAHCYSFSPTCCKPMLPPVMFSCLCQPWC